MVGPMVLILLGSCVSKIAQYRFILSDGHDERKVPMKQANSGLTRFPGIAGILDVATAVGASMIAGLLLSA